MNRRTDSRAKNNSAKLKFGHVSQKYTDNSVAYSCFRKLATPWGDCSGHY